MIEYEVVILSHSKKNERVCLSVYETIKALLNKHGLEVLRVAPAVKKLNVNGLAHRLFARRVTARSQADPLRLRFRSRAPAKKCVPMITGQRLVIARKTEDR